MPELTDRELDVMHVLWERGASTVSEVRERLTDELAYTTVLTVLQTLEIKGHVSHRKEGRAYRYSSRVERVDAQRSVVRGVVDRIFRGSPGALAAHLVDDAGMSEDELRRLRRLLDRRLKGGEGS